MPFSKYWWHALIGLYALGLLVHNVYLSQFGFSEFELIQTNYILSGFGFVAFIAVTFFYTSIKVNLSHIPQSLRPVKLLPWLLRVFSFPYVVYSLLHGDAMFSESLSDHWLEPIAAVFFVIAVVVVQFAIFDLILMISDGDDWGARLTRMLLTTLAVPMVLVTLAIAWNVPEFFGVLITTVSVFVLFMGAALRQQDNKHGINPKYLDTDAGEKAEHWFRLGFGVVAIFFMLGGMIHHYAKQVYPHIPVAIGGAQTEIVEVHYRGEVYRGHLVQQSDKWLFFVNKETGNSEQLKISEVERIVNIDRDYRKQGR